MSMDCHEDFALVVTHLVISGYFPTLIQFFNEGVREWETGLALDILSRAR